MLADFAIHSDCIFCASFFILYFSYSTGKCIGNASTHHDMLISYLLLAFPSHAFGYLFARFERLLLQTGFALVFIDF